MHCTPLLPALFAVLFAAFAPSLRGQAPEWIWSSGKAGENDVRYFRKPFRMTDAPETAILRFACDNKAAVFLDGRSIGENSEWHDPTVVDLTKQLKSGDHLIAVRAENQGGAAGLVLTLDVAFPSTKKMKVVSDASWQVANSAVPGWNELEGAPKQFAAATSLGKVGVQPWGDVLAAGAVRMPRRTGEATPAESLKVAEGFKVELLRSSQPGEGSWVSMTVDPKGRLIVSPQDKEPMLRFTLGPDGKIARMETISLPVNGAMGLLYAFDSLYVNGSGPDGYHLYRLRDTDGDDRFDKFELIRKWKGGPGEHGAHGIVLGPDKKLYMVCGNFVDVPDDRASTSPHRHYADDHVLPRMEDGNGFGAGRKPPGGYVVRMDPDGSNVELFASGERNTYDIAFNPVGELFGFDSDMEWDWGAPWYRPTRVYHIVSGGDQGFREGSGKWPEYFPDSLPAAVNVGIGSPTGVKFGTAAKFPGKYQRAFYAMDWSYGRILAVHLAPNGSSYGGSFETFVAGKPLNVTDLEFGQDGAMYFTIGGRKTQGGLYRVSYPGKVAAEKLPSDSKAADARALRHQLEAFHGKTDPAAIDVAWPHLDSQDRFIRYAARIAIEGQPVESWQKKAIDETRKRASLTALLALSRLGSKEIQEELLEALGRHWPDELDADEKVEALRVCEVCIARMGLPGESVVADIISKTAPLYPAKTWRLNRELSQILIALNAPGVVKKTLDLRDASTTQEEQVHYMVALRNIKTGWSLDERRRYFAWFRDRPKTEDGGPTYPGGSSYFISRNTRHSDEMVQWFKDVGREYGDGASFANFLKNLRKAGIESLSDNEKGELAPLIVDAQPAAARPPKKDRKFVREWKTADLLNDLDAAGKGRNFENGREAFAATQCLACHRFGNEGGPIGPDITAVASRFSRKDILESILEPSKVVSEQYQNINVTKKDGDEVTGRLVEETDAKLVIVPDQLTGAKVEVRKADVQSRSASKLSPMPEGLVNTLTKEELLDLLAYIESAGRKSHAAFRAN
jgi:putative heme-binding domain-containing protein